MLVLRCEANQWKVRGEKFLQQNNQCYIKYRSNYFMFITTNKRTASQHLKPFGFLQKSFYLMVNRFTLQSHYHVYNPQFQQAAVFSDQAFSS